MAFFITFSLLLSSHVQFMQCIYRKPNECKERHKILMDRTSGDGADSAEDSGSSQPYPSTLPGIPKVQYLFTSVVPLSSKLFINQFESTHAGKCQTAVSAFAGANGRGYAQIAF